MARLLGEAYIAIMPDTSQFGPATRAAIDKDVASIRPEAQVRAQLDKSDVAKIATQLKAVSKANPINVGVSLNQASAAKMAAQLQAYMRGHTAEIGVQVSTAQLGKMASTLDAYLHDRDLEVGVQLNPAQLAKIQGTYDTFVKQLNSERVSPNWNVLPAMSKIAMLKSANDSLRAYVQSQNAQQLGFNIMPALREIAEVKTAEAALGGSKSEDLNVNAQGLQSTESAISRITSALIGLTKSEGDNGDAVANVSRGYGLWGRAIGILQAKIPLFGGALQALHFPDWLAQASGIHILTEAVIETLGVWVPAAIAATAFGLAAYKAGKDIYTQFMSMSQVMNATGADFKGLSSNANSLSEAVRPQVYQLFGDYLLLAGKNSGTLGTALRDVGDGLDKIGAKIVDLAGNGGGFAKFIEGGSKDLDILIAAFGQLGKIIDVFLRSVPGYAIMLLKLGTAALGVTADILGAIQPVIKWGLAIHGAIFYLGLASTAAIAFGRGALSAGAQVLSTGEKMENTGSKVQGLGVAFGNLVGTFANVGQKAYTMTRILLGMDTVAGVSEAINSLDVSLKGLADSEAVVAGVTEVEDALKGLKDAETAAAGMTILNRAIESLKDVTEADAAIQSLDDALDALKVAEAGAAATGILERALTLIPFGPAGLAAAGLAAIVGVGLYFAFHHAADAADALNTALEKQISASDISDIQKNISSAITLTSQAMRVQQVAVAKLNYTYSTYGGGTVVKSNKQIIGSYAQAGELISQYQQHLQTLTAQQVTANSRIGELSKTYGGLSAVQEIVTLSGIKQSDVANAQSKAWAQDTTQIRATAAAYGFMGQQAGAAGNQLDTLLLSQKQQTKAVQALTGAEQAFLSTITGGVTAYTTFEQGQSTLASDLGLGSAAAVKLTTSSGKLTQQQKLVKTAMDGTSTSALAAQQAFASQVTQAGTLYGNLQTLAAATNNTKTSQIALAKAGKDMVAQLLPMAKGSKTATAEVYALAQVVGYTGPDSFSKLEAWLGKTKGSEADLGKQTGILTQSAAGLQKDMQLLAGTMSGQVDSAMASAIFFANGGQKAFNNLAVALKNLNNDQTPQHFQAVEKALKPVAAQLVATVGPGQAAENMFITLAAKMGVSNKEAEALWQGLEAGQQNEDNLGNATQRLGSTFQNLVSGPLKLSQSAVAQLWSTIKQQDLDMVSGKAQSAKAAFIDFAENGLHKTSTEAEDLWRTAAGQQLTMLSGKAGTTKAQFVDLAENGLGLTKTQASELWAEMRLQYLDTLAAKGDNAKNSFINLAEKGLGYTATQANNLWNTLKQQYLDTLASKAGETESAFEQVAAKFGLSKTAADNLWTSLRNLAGGSPYNVAVQELLSGSGSISAKISAAGIVLGGGGGVLTPKGANPKTNPAIGTSQDIHAAAGAWISGVHSNTDTVPIMAKPGELIVPPTHAASVANHMAAGGYKVPGYASGGLVQQGPALAQSNTKATQGVETDVASFANLVNSSFSNLVSGAYTAAQGVGGAYGGPASFGGGYESLSALVAFARYFMQNGLNAAAAAGMAATISGEEDSAGPESRNCVPLYYKVVTTRGVLAHDEVAIGDQTMGWNVETGEPELATILDAPYHYDAEMCQIGNAQWIVECTIDHKWVTKNRGLVRADRLRMGETIILGNGREEQVFDFERTDNQDSFCLTTTAGTWTVETDFGDQVLTGNSDGWGLIGWTGNTVGLPPGYSGPTGNVSYDLQEQLKGVIGYMNAKGGPGPLNAAGNAVAAGQVWSRYEGPASPLSDTRASVANEIYAELVGTAAAGAKAAVSTASALAASIPKITLAKGGWIEPNSAGGAGWRNTSKIKPHSAGGMISEPVYGFGAQSGTPYSFAENGPEMISPANPDSTNNFMQPMTQSQGQQLLNALNTLIQQGQQLPANLSRVQKNGLTTGMRRGAFNTGG